MVEVEGVSKKFCRRLRHSLVYGMKDFAREITGRSHQGEVLRPNEFWALRNVSFSVRRGETLALIGRNGAGKSTTLRAISGLVKLTSGTINFSGKNLSSLPPYRIAELGIAHVPEGRQVFPELTVQENLEIGAFVPNAKAERSRSL